MQLIRRPGTILRTRPSVPQRPGCGTTLQAWLHTPPLLPPCCASGAGGGQGPGGDEGSPESSIDELAAMLSKRAAEMRASSRPLDAPSLPPDPLNAADNTTSSGAEGGDTEASGREIKPPLDPELDLPTQRQQGRSFERAAAAALPVAMPPHDNEFIAADFQVCWVWQQRVRSVLRAGVAAAAGAALLTSSPLVEATLALRVCTACGTSFHPPLRPCSPTSPAPALHAAGVQDSRPASSGAQGLVWVVEV
jgi:hypothetical protein